MLCWLVGGGVWGGGYLSKILIMFVLSCYLFGGEGSIFVTCSGVVSLQLAFVS